MMKEVSDVQKKQDAHSQHWSAYKDSLAYIQAWLDNIEASLKNEQVNWLSVQETKSRLLKLKAVVQDINSQKRYIESVNEKGAAVINSNPSAPSEEIKENIDNVNYRYDALMENMKGSIVQMEAAIDFIQQYQDLVREHQVFLKSFCLDNSF